jgi:hypothetical protein
MATYLTGLDLPNVTSDATVPDAGFSHFYVSENKLYRRTSGGVTEALSFEDLFLAVNERNPTFSYTGDNLTRVDYQSGNYKLLTYDVDSNLVQLDFIRGSNTFRKVFNLDAFSNIASITYSVI